MTTQRLKKPKKQCLKQIENVVCKRVGGKGILLHLDSGAYFEISAVGLLIWSACNGKRSHEEIIEKVLDRFPPRSSQRVRDVKQFITQLKRRRLLCA